MVVLVAPTPSTTYVRLALLVNGFAMIAWAPVVAYGKEMIRRAEGPRAVEKKTPFDLMILRICGLWVFFAGSACLACLDTPKVAEQLASYLVVIHFTEVCLKHQASKYQASVGRRFFVEAASGNAILGCLLLAALALDYASKSRKQN